MKFTFKNLLTVLVIAAVFLLLREFRQQGLVEGDAPALVANNLDGNLVSLAEYRGKPLLLHFWATWCSICRFEQDSIEAIAKDWPVVTVAMQSGNDAELAEYMKEHALMVDTINDPEGAQAGRFGVRGVPTSFFLDETGRIRFTEVGYTTGIGLRVRLWLAKVL